MPASSSGVNPDRFVNTAFNFLNHTPPGFPLTRTLPQLLTAWDARTVLWLQDMDQDGADLHSCTALPV